MTAQPETNRHHTYNCPPCPRDIVYYTRGLEARRRRRRSSFFDSLLAGAGADAAADAPAASAEAAAPVLFLHGVGGLVIYLDLIRSIVNLGGPVIAVDIRHVGMRLRCGSGWVGMVGWFVGLLLG
jgi:hypothetical protein